MGFVEDIQAGINRGTESAQRAARSAKLKMEASELMRQRKDLAAQLGASLFDMVKEMPECRAGRESLFDAIEAIDMKRAGINAELEALTAEAAASQQSAVVYQCPRCGSNVLSTDHFCTGCGCPIEEVVAAYEKLQAATMQNDSNGAPSGGIVCANCKAILKEGDAYCVECGAPVVTAEDGPSSTAASEVDQPNNACPACGGILMDDDEYCMNCGLRVSNCDLPDSGEDAEGYNGAYPPGNDAVAAFETVEEKTIPTCPSCGQEVAPDDVYCGGCGMQLAETTS
ncbi:MAG: zinc ribbon domain-containing protein [Eggerthellaceae bacterium]|nr:zinc ribbon domain-containing protein [Eggerthellaceae bacterium]